MGFKKLAPKIYQLDVISKNIIVQENEFGKFIKQEKRLKRSKERVCTR